jgi:hypothetical protein
MDIRRAAAMPTSRIAAMPMLRTASMSEKAALRAEVRGGLVGGFN